MNADLDEGRLDTHRVDIDLIVTRQQRRDIRFHSLAVRRGRHQVVFAGANPMRFASLKVRKNPDHMPITTEREMKRVVLSRKSSLFVGRHAAAVLSSLTSSCKRHEIDPQQYLTQLLTNARTLTPDQWPAWLPDEWNMRST